jgi:hypothetical protein
MRTAEDILLNKPWIEEGIFCYVFEPNTILTLTAAKELVQERLKISGNLDYPLYIDVRGIISVDTEARNFLSGEEGTKNAIAAAIHVDNPMSKFFANLFLTVNKPQRPTKLFTKKEAAIRWLKKFKKSSG